MAAIIRQLMAVNCKIYRRSELFMAVLPSDLNVYIERLRPSRAIIVIDKMTTIPINVKPRYDSGVRHYVITLPKKLNLLWEQLWREGKAVDVILETGDYG